MIIYIVMIMYNMMICNDMLIFKKD